MMKLIIAEKPSVARTIAEALSTHVVNKKDWYEAGEWTVSFALGHIINLSYPEDYNPKWKKWEKESLPIIPSTLKYRILNKQRYSVLSKLIKQADVIVNACDAGREGELIFRELITLTPPKKGAKLYRLWLTALTKEQILKAMQELKPLSSYDSLYKAAQSRAVADWLIGINATRAYTLKAGELYSIGRVQTPTLYAVVKREEERAKQTDKIYYEVVGTFHSEAYQGVLQTQAMLETVKEAQAVAGSIAVGSEGVISSYQNKVVAVAPQLLYDLTTLQKEANTQYGYTAQQTLAAVQSLYEKGAVSYPRTDSRYLPSSLKAEATRIAHAIADRSLSIGEIYHAVVNDAGVTDHYALIPTGKAVSFSSDKERKVYELIEKRFLSVFLGHSKVQRQSFDTVVNSKYVFHTEREALLEPGWQIIYNKKAQKPLEDVSKEKHKLTALDVVEKVKHKDPPLTDASLLRFMEHAGKTGLGTPATRAEIIEKLVDQKYLLRKGKTLLPTEKGIKLVKSLEQLGATELLSPELTAYFEQALKEIEQGKKTDEAFLKEIEQYTKRVTARILEANAVSA